MKAYPLTSSSIDFRSGGHESNRVNYKVMLDQAFISGITVGFVRGVETMMAKQAVENIEQEEIHYLREIPLDLAKDEIKQYFEDHHGEELTAADAAIALLLDFDLAAEACDELEREGKIKGV